MKKTIFLLTLLICGGCQKQEVNQPVQNVASNDSIRVVISAKDSVVFLFTLGTTYDTYNIKPVKTLNYIFTKPKGLTFCSVNVAKEDSVNFQFYFNGVLQYKQNKPSLNYTYQIN